VLLQVKQETGRHGHSALLALPDDSLLLVLRLLPLQDLVRSAPSLRTGESWVCRCEQVCSGLREVVVQYGLYKARLDSICRRKRINNYMVLPER
jgi:hypothetical protein